ncbi:MAG: wax ester/triacylglycerol synthase family O-acyltransferase [Polyangiales bacterium]
MQPLSGMDASFLYMEDPRTPMHVGSVLIFDGSMQFEDFRSMLKSRIHLVPRMQQRLVMVPLGLGKPYWIDDPDFNLDRHIQHIGLPRPGGWRQLRQLAARTFSMPLDRRRPLWDMLFVEGLDEIPQVPPGSVAMINRVHHAAIDGVSGADMMSILFDITKEPREVPPPPPKKIAPAPNELQVLRQVAHKIAGKPARVPLLLRDLANVMRAGKEARIKGMEVPPAPFSAPATPLNKVVSQERCWNTALLEFDRVRVIKETMGCTLNDAVLAICAGALRRYLLDKDALPSEPLVAFVPISTRSKDQRGDMGNQVSGMSIQLATNIADPIERIQEIKQHTRSGKSYQNAVGAQTMADVFEFVPFGLAGQASRLYSRFRVAERHRPPFNLVITNVPGPQHDMYVAGHRLLSTMGMAPVMDGMSLLITVLSYNGVLSISPTSCPEVMPDLDTFARYLRESANELEADVLKFRGQQPQKDKGASKSDVSAEEMAVFFEQVRTALANANAESLGTATFQFEVTGDHAQAWVVDVPNRSVTEGTADGPDATLTIRDEHLAQITRGNLDPQIAFVQGKLRVNGDVSKAIEFGAFLPGVAR